METRQNGKQARLIYLYKILITLQSLLTLFLLQAKNKTSKKFFLNIFVPKLLIEMSFIKSVIRIDVLKTITYFLNEITNSSTVI